MPIFVIKAYTIFSSFLKRRHTIIGTFGVVFFLLLLLSFPIVHASPVRNWSIISIKKAPCLTWSTLGNCINWDSEYQYIPDYDGMIVTLKIFTKFIQDLDKRVFMLERKSKPSIISTSNEIPRWSLQAVKDAPCLFWDGNGYCINYYTKYQYFPDYDNTVNVLHIYNRSIDGLDKRIAVLEGKLKSPIQNNSSRIPQWTLTSVKDAPCLVWSDIGGTGSCANFYSTYRYFPDFKSVMSILHVFNKFMNGLDARISVLEGLEEKVSKSQSKK